MKSRFLSVLMALGFCTLYLAPRAEAVLTTLDVGESATFSYDGATASPACSLCDALVTLTFNGNELVISFSNTSTDGLAGVNVLTQFAFNSTPDLDLGTASFAAGPGSTWEFKETGLGSFEFGADTSNGINDGLEGGQTGSVTVAITSPTNLLSLDIDATQTHFQSINEVGGTSTKPQGVCTDCGGSPGGSPGQVPEPSTLVLLGSGLLALCGIGRKFRQKK